MEELLSIIKPWPTSGWTMDLIDKIHLASSNDHLFIIVTNDFFKKWVEALLMRKVDKVDVI